jgi:hypothetical protein
VSLELSPAKQQRKRRQFGPTAPLVFTVDEFVDAHRISRTHLYKLWRKGLGPRFKLVGAKRLITTEAAAAWRIEDETKQSKPTPPGKRGGDRRSKKAA